LDHTNNLFLVHLDHPYLNKKRTTYIGYHHYSLVLSEWSWATEEGTCDASESEAARTRAQRASTSSSVNPALRPDPSTSRSVSSSRKCDTTVINAE
jgi:hypothetical protein